MDEVLAALNEQTDDAWTATGRLAGGFQQGAFGLRAADGRRAVLKLGHARGAARLAMLSTLVERARAHGWPTPVWLAHGIAPDGLGWYVYEFVAGECPESVDTRLAAALLPVVDLQAGMRPDTSQDWSRYAYAVVFANESEFTSRLAAFSPAGAATVDTILRAGAIDAAVQLPTDDLVHGNLDPGNIVVRDGVVVGIIDVEAAGKGTRCIDLAGLIVSADLFGARDATDRLVRAGRDVAGPAVLRICVAAAVFALLAFGVEHWPHDVDAASAACVDLWTSLQ